MAKRKLWATSFPRIATPKRRHESKAAVYRWVRGEAANWLAGALRSQYMAVWIDDRDGRGFQVYEHIDLATFGAGEGEDR